MVGAMNTVMKHSMKNSVDERVLRVSFRVQGFSDRTKMLAAALTISEMRFRTWTHRLIEYSYVLILILIRQDAGSVTIGVSQISVRHIRNLLDTNDFGALRAATSAETSLKMCCQLIGSYSELSIRDVALRYNGDCSIYYLSTLDQAYKEILSHPSSVKGKAPD